MVFNVIFNNISVIWYRSVLLVIATAARGRNHRPTASHWETLLHSECPEHLSSHPVLSGVRVMFCRSLFVLSYFFSWPFCCLFFFDIRILITRLVSVISSCSTSGTRRVNLVTNMVISHEWGKDQEVFTTSGIYPWLFVTLIFYNGQRNPGFLFVKLKSSLRTFYGRHHDFVDRYKISVSQITTDIFHLS
jgi:hypothetical protein